MPCLLASSASLGNVSEPPERRPRDTRKDSRDRNFVEPMRGHAAAVLFSKPDNGTINIDALRQAIIGKESEGDFSAVNPDSEALGYGQVMPENVAS